MFLRNDYANSTQTLRISYAKFFTQNTHNLRKYVYAGITQFSCFYAIILRRNYAEITQIKYAFITHITQYYANNLRRYYANNLRKSLRRLRNHYANKLRKCDYANTHNCITQITQMPIFFTQKFGSLRNGQLADGLEYSYQYYNITLNNMVTISNNIFLYFTVLSILFSIVQYCTILSSVL